MKDVEDDLTRGCKVGSIASWENEVNVAGWHLLLERAQLLRAMR